MPQRQIALLTGHPTEETRQFRGMPPELTQGVDSREPMPEAKMLIITLKKDGIFLERFSGEGEFAGDTWHQSVLEAKQQAEAEYGDRVGTWTPVPVDVEDVVAFGLEKLR